VELVMLFHPNGRENDMVRRLQVTVEEEDHKRNGKNQN